VLGSHVAPAAHWLVVAQLAWHPPVASSHRYGAHCTGVLLVSTGTDAVPSAEHFAVGAGEHAPALQV